MNLIGRIKLNEKTGGVEQQIEDMKRATDLAMVELRLYEHIQEERLERENKTRTRP